MLPAGNAGSRYDRIQEGILPFTIFQMWRNYGKIMGIRAPAGFRKGDSRQKHIDRRTPANGILRDKHLYPCTSETIEKYFTGFGRDIFPSPEAVDCRGHTDSLFGGRTAMETKVYSAEPAPRKAPPQRCGRAIAPLRIPLRVNSRQTFPENAGGNTMKKRRYSEFDSHHPSHGKVEHPGPPRHLERMKNRYSIHHTLRLYIKVGTRWEKIKACNIPRDT